MSRIRLNIDRVALQGFNPAERDALITGLRAQLERVLTDPQSRAALRSHSKPVLRLGTLSFQPGPTGSRALGSQIGSQIARATERSSKP